MTKDEGRLVALVETIAATAGEAEATPDTARAARVLQEVSRELRQSSPSADAVISALISGSLDAR